eukprot:CAMPEP_0119048864 /NCGR_PEP_ID=MMETSP1177-20130426/61480_1 /TAXON_ID=2985 /ORGANISM="Ochromonas sp, Strain CCMP1899" /LENGTH=156 /DNA_ID=CAMNT_0007025337 /DNA_START=553 /DNA_END=1019 /DNA_ORIENTATION=-
MDSPQHQESSLHNHETKGSKKNRDKLTLDHLAESAILSPPVLAPVSQPKHQWYERAHPLAVFDAFWLSNKDQEVSIHISLVERSNEAFRSQFWLRIGSICEDQDNRNSEEEAELEVLGLISNDVGRLLMPVGCDWVALETIDPNEHYVVTYLQNIL